MDENRKREMEDKIKKLLMLASNNDNPMEAEAAMAMAASLMDKYNIELTPDSPESGVKSEFVDSHSNATYATEGVFLNRIATIFHCSMICVTLHHHPDGSKFVPKTAEEVLQNPEFNKGWHLFGREHEINLATWYFKYLRLMLKKQMEKDNVRKNDVNYIYGFMLSVVERLTTIFKEAEVQAQDTSKALVVKAEADASAMLHKLYPHVKKKQHNAQLDAYSESMRKGHKAGNEVSLSMPVSGEATKTQKIGGRVALK